MAVFTIYGKKLLLSKVAYNRDKVSFEQIILHKGPKCLFGSPQITTIQLVSSVLSF